MSLKHADPVPAKLPAAQEDGQKGAEGKGTVQPDRM